ASGKAGQSAAKRTRFGRVSRTSSSFSSRSAWRRQVEASRASARAVRRHLPWPSQVANPPMTSPRAKAPSRNRNSGASMPKPDVPSKGLSPSATGLRLTTASAMSSTPSGTRTRPAMKLRITAAPLHQASDRTISAVEAFAKFLAGLKEGDEFILDKHCIPGARIAALPRGAMLHGECSEAAQLHSIAAGKRAGNFIEHDVDDALDVALK